MQTSLNNVIDKTLQQMGVDATLQQLLDAQTRSIELVHTNKMLQAEIANQVINTNVGDIPYTVEEKPVSELFNGLSGRCMLPMLNWVTRNPDVPLENLDYLVDNAIVADVLMGIEQRSNTWLYGPSGCGKDEALRYVAAKLNLPLITISFDADISRAELIGRDHLHAKDGGGTYSEFLEGVLPKALRQPCILALDEFDFIREDVAYVMQTVLNEGKLTLLEKDGEVIHRHPLCFIAATANTNGKYDDMGRHNGSRELSSALLDRYTNWVKADYLSAEQYKNLFQKFCDVDAALIEKFCLWVKKYQELYVNGDTQTPLSNRAVIAIAKSTQTPDELMPSIERVFLNRLTTYDKDKAIELFSKLDFYKDYKKAA